MNMTIKVLSEIPYLAIYHSFQAAFEDYPLPLEFAPPATLQRWQTAGVNFDFSYGVFEEGQLVAFVLHAPLNKILFNFATGVIPSHRGRHFIHQIYERLEKDHLGFETLSLEVLKGNLRAQNLYQSLGFTIKRELICLKGQLQLPEVDKNELTYHIRPLRYHEEQDSIRPYEPAFEGRREILLKTSQFYEVHELRSSSKLVAYAIFRPETLEIKEMGVRAPQWENLDRLFWEMKLNHENLSVTKIDQEQSELITYFGQRNLTSFAPQIEMSRPYSFLQVPR
jgi:RimJ/RimL family protein N-acetyltransferase